MFRSHIPDGCSVMVSIEISITLTLMFMFHMLNRMNLKQFIGFGAGYLE